MLWRLATVLILACGPVWPQGLSLGTPVTSTVQSPVLVIDFDQAFATSAFGRRVVAQIEAEGQAIAEENRQIEAELVAEERELTETRASMETAQFRVLADDFNAKVQRLRAEQDEKARALGERSDALRRIFIEAVRPVLQDLMLEAGAAVILEQRSVFLVADPVDVTRLAVVRIDRAIGDGSALDVQATQDVPANAESTEGTD